MEAPKADYYLNQALTKLQQENAETPCRENSLAITKTEEALMWLERRATEK